MVVVGVSVVLVIFLTSLIEGLRVQLVKETTGAIPHIVIQPTPREPLRPASLSDDQTDVVGTRSTWTRERTTIDDWRRWTTYAERFGESVVAVAPVAEGAGFAARGSQRYPIRIFGVEPRSYDRVVPIQPSLERGRFYRLGAEEAAIGAELAKNLGVDLGDRIRVTSSEGARTDKRVVGIFRTGFSGLDEGALFIPLGDAQALLGLGAAVTSIGIRVSDVFEAEGIAIQMARQVPHEVRDWTQDNTRLLGALQAQKRSSDMITGFTALAASFAIASILIVLVTNKLREIGILKAMGATRRQIRAIFAIQGAVLGGMGAVVGSVFGVLLVLGLASIRVVQPGTGRLGPLFPFELWPELIGVTILLSTLLGLLAAIIPARRAANVDPMEVIRGE
jgi:lipoprotein-releasing system permease protein